MRRLVRLSCAVSLLLASGCKKQIPESAAPAPSDSTSSVVTSAAVPSPSAGPVAEGAEGGRPLYYSRPVTDADLEGRTLRQLDIMRNFIFARAGQTFRKDWLRDYFARYTWYHPVPVAADVDQLGRDNAAKIANFAAAISHDDLQKRADEVLARMKGERAEPTDALELRLLSERLGTWLLPSAAGVRPSPLEKPELLAQVLKLDDLANLSRRDLRILRNTIYARKGRDFVSEGLREYFAAKAWYVKDDAYSDQKLSPVDWKNIKLVSSVEDTLGGPLSDGEHFGRKYAWFGEA